MALAPSKILKLTPTVLSMLLPGLFNPAKGIGRVAAAGLSKKGLRGAAFDYPALTDDFYYGNMDGRLTVPDTKTYVDGQETVKPALNVGINRGDAGAALVQTLQQHNKAVANGTESQLSQWWPGQDTKPRIMFNPTSTAVEGVRITTDGKIQVKWLKGSKWYTYKGGDDLRETTEIAKELLTAPSIGRAVARMAWGKYPTKYRHTDSKDLLGPKERDPELGWWGAAHFDPTAIGG